MTQATNFEDLRPVRARDIAGALIAVFVSLCALCQIAKSGTRPATPARLAGYVRLVWTLYHDGTLYGRAQNCMAAPISGVVLILANDVPVTRSGFVVGSRLEQVRSVGDAERATLASGHTAAIMITTPWEGEFHGARVEANVWSPAGWRRQSVPYTTENQPQ